MKHGHNNEPPRIVVGVDGFESSKAALRWASTGGLTFAPAEFEDHVIEEHVPHSTALHARLAGRHHGPLELLAACIART